MWGMYMHMCVHVHVVLHACIFVCVCGMSMGAWYVCMCLSVVCAWYVYMDVSLHTSTDFWLADLNIQLHLPKHTQGQSLGRVWALRRNWDPEPVRYVLYLESRVLHMLGLSISDPSTSHIFPVTEGRKHTRQGGKNSFHFVLLCTPVNRRGQVCVCVGG